MLGLDSSKSNMLSQSFNESDIKNALSKPISEISETFNINPLELSGLIASESNNENFGVIE